MASRSGHREAAQLFAGAFLICWNCPYFAGFVQALRWTQYFLPDCSLHPTVFMLSKRFLDQRFAFAL
jgi:hypothetical protein